MHNIDRTLQEFESGVATNSEYENYETSGEYGQELGQEFEYEEEMGQEFEEEFGQEFSGETNGENFEMSQEEELVGELLEVTNEQELNQFLGSLVSKVAGAASQLAKSPAGQSVGRYLVDFGKKTLPQLAGQYGGQTGAALGGRAGAALGGRLGPLGARAGQWAGSKAGGYAGSAAGNWAGTQAGNFLADNAKKVFGLEFEALSPESQELEIARAYVRFASDVARRANRALRRNPRLRPGALGRQVLTATAPYYAPGLLNGDLQLSGPTRRASCGRWERRDGVVVLYGL
ncbi:hypothetical protein MUN81_13505 [Hymenobacter sp. 5317J-9]|uniref:hypothetical protein n=1 Tax=Hymenobacter sp. 5317J-9 TaxID=2932250 RepID=UPI001FD6513D|nr:hypothetical protein [Hymenobacter sp. 5317J-9]UOQ96264.1 hypothetical protein MUN81_13505 [Hymenobacter sp. 5317J-9]